MSRVPFWVRFGVCFALVYVYATVVIWHLREWPWIAAAFTLPLPATLGALYVEHRASASRGDGNEEPVVADDGRHQKVEQ